ncbi:MAG: oxidoreductase C-terminal domain-containing protein, partial [Pseudorhodoplanes sp.]
SWQNAERQGRIAAGTMLGSPAIYSETPWFWTDQYEDNIQLLGAPTRWDREIRRGCPEDGKFSAFLLQDGIVVGAAFVNDARNVRPTRLAIEKRQAADPALLEQPEVPVARAFA